MNLHPDEINKIAHLARLAIPKDQINDIINDLDGILALIVKMDDVDTSEIDPLFHPLDEVQRLREDQVTATNQRELFQEIAPEISAGLYIVPKVIENEE